MSVSSRYRATALVARTKSSRTLPRTVWAIVSEAESQKATTVASTITGTVAEESAVADRVPWREPTTLHPMVASESGSHPRRSRDRMLAES